MSCYQTIKKYKNKNRDYQDFLSIFVAPLITTFLLISDGWTRPVIGVLVMSLILRQFPKGVALGLLYSEIIVGVYTNKDLLTTVISVTLLVLYHYLYHYLIPEPSMYEIQHCENYRLEKESYPDKLYREWTPDLIKSLRVDNTPSTLGDKKTKEIKRSKQEVINEIVEMIVEQLTIPHFIPKYQFSNGEVNRKLNLTDNNTDKTVDTLVDFYLEDLLKFNTVTLDSDDRKRIKQLVLELV